MTGKKTSFSIVTALAAVAAIAILVFSRSVAVEAAYPFERASRFVRHRIVRPLCAMFDAAAATAENSRLKREIELLVAFRDENENLHAEIDRLRKVLGYAEKSKRKVIAAEVLSRGGGAAGGSGTLRIGKGSGAGVRKGAIVLSSGALAGRVVSVTAHTAEVELVSGDSSRVACEVEGGGMCGILCGGGDRLLLKYISGGRIPPPRARVYSSGRGGVFPARRFVGWLVDVVDAPDGTSRIGRVEPAADLDGMEDVAVEYED